MKSSRDLARRTLLAFDREAGDQIGLASLITYERHYPIGPSRLLAQVRHLGTLSMERKASKVRW
jgi:hypothetical protein